MKNIKLTIMAFLTFHTAPNFSNALQVSSHDLARLSKSSLAHVRHTPYSGSTKVYLTGDDGWSSFSSPSEAYRHYLTYADNEVREGIRHNQEVINFLNALYSPESAKPQSFWQKLIYGRSSDHLKVVQTHAGKFYSLSKYLGAPLKASKINIRNLDDNTILFNFTNEIPYGYALLSANPDRAQKINMARRNIVPSLFSKTPGLAGTLGFHEFLIDGSAYKEQETGLLLELNLHPDTPIKISMDNCKGLWEVKGPEKIKKKFELDDNSKWEKGLPEKSIFPIRLGLTYKE